MQFKSPTGIEFYYRNWAKTPYYDGPVLTGTVTDASDFSKLSDQELYLISAKLSDYFAGTSYQCSMINLSKVG
jgi:hypothetical protein